MILGIPCTSHFQCFQDLTWLSWKHGQLHVIFYAPGASEPISGGSEDNGPSLSHVCKGCLILGRFLNVFKSQPQNGDDSDDDIDDDTMVS